MRITVLAVVALTSWCCGGVEMSGPPDCVSGTGAQVWNSGRCAEFDQAERHIIARWAEHMQIPDRSIVERAQHLRLRVRQDADSYGKFLNDSHDAVLGVYWNEPEGGRIDVGLDDWQRSSLAHEYAHLIEEEVIGKSGEEWGCSAEEIEFTAIHYTGKRDAAAHCSWARRGLWREINTMWN